MNNENTIKIVITDDHSIFSDGLKRLIDTEQGLEVVGVAENLKVMWYVLAKNTADVLLLDLNLGKDDGLDAVKKIKLYYPKLKIIILTTYNLHKQIDILKKQGVSGYLRKNVSTDILISTIKSIQNGTTYFDTEEVFDDENVYEQSDDFLKKHNLTSREADIIRLVAKGLSSKKIGETLHISEYTVKAHRRNIKSKLHLASNSEMVQFAISIGLVN
jgi:DNA-binding NarL/FixJ family response regulator